MNTVNKIFAYSLVGLTIGSGGCRTSDVKNEVPAKSSIVAEEKPIEPKEEIPTTSLLIKTAPVLFKIEGNGVIKLGVLKEDQISRALRESGVKEEHIEIFARNIKEKFAYYEELVTTGDVKVMKLQYVEDLDLKGVELEVLSGDDFDLGMGFPGEVDSRPTSDLQVDPDSLLLTDKGVYFEFTEGNNEEVKKGLVKPKFGRPIIFYFDDKEVIIVDPTKGIVIEEKEEKPKPREDDKVASGNIFLRRFS